MTQLDLFGRTHLQQFEEWVHTPEGGRIAYRFIRIAIGLRRRGHTHFGAKAIWERIRWTELARRPASGALACPEAGRRASLREPSDPSPALNNNWTAYMARFAMDQEKELRGFFRTRETGGRNEPSRALVIPIKKTA